MEGLLAFLAVVLVVIFFASLRICSEWERKVVLRLGRFAGVRGPGIFFLLPFVERTPFTVDLRTVTSAFTAEQTLTRDNVPVNVDTIIYWRVTDPGRAVLQVEDYRAAVMGAAQTALRDIIGRSNLAQVLSERQSIDEELTRVLDAQTEPWGVKATAVLMRDIKIPAALQDAMSRVAQAERERDARVILGESETLIAQRFADAGSVYADNPMALHLRGMNMLYETMKQGNGSIVIIPSSAVESMALGGMTGMTALAMDAANSTPPALSGNDQSL
ncbi:MAG TPA: SPFH domain-containing protein [Chloroflexia bacterium]|nr:SPFH domain-containing protein [Chloroflexia bacterium]